MSISAGSGVNVANAFELQNSSRRVTIYGCYYQGDESWGTANTSLLNGNMTSLTGGSIRGKVYVDLGAPSLLEHIDVYFASGSTTIVNQSGFMAYTDYDGSSTDPYNEVSSWSVLDAPDSVGQYTGAIHRARWTPTSPVNARWLRIDSSGDAKLSEIQALAVDCQSSDTGDASGVVGFGLTSGVLASRDDLYNFQLDLARTPAGSTSDPQQVWVVNTGSGIIYDTEVFIVKDPEASITTYNSEDLVEIAYTSSGTWGDSLTIPSGTGQVAASGSESFWIRANVPADTPYMNIRAYVRLHCTRTDI